MFVNWVCESVASRGHRYWRGWLDSSLVFWPGPLHSSTSCMPSWRLLNPGGMGVVLSILNLLSCRMSLTLFHPWASSFSSKGARESQDGRLFSVSCDSSPAHSWHSVFRELHGKKTKWFVPTFPLPFQKIVRVEYSCFASLAQGWHLITAQLIYGRRAWRWISYFSHVRD